MSTIFRVNAASLSVLYTLLASATASPLPTHLLKRDMTAGAKAGLGIGIAVAIIIVGLVITFFVMHMRRHAHNDSLNRQRAILAGEKNPDGTDKVDKFVPEPPQVSSIPRRNKSVKDRLMGPLYRESMMLPSMPNRAKIGSNSNRQSTMTLGDGEHLNKPWATNENSPRPSFSSKRATRMMMMM